MARTPAGERTDKKRLEDTVFCAIDLETTGLSSLSRIVEVGAVRFRVGEEGEGFQRLVDPCCSIPYGAGRVHGITDDMVANAPRAPEVLAELFAFARDGVIVAHNARYDTMILSTELERAGMEMPPNDVVCTIKAAKHFLPRLPNYRLQTVTEALSIDPGNAHRALSDAESARSIFEKAVTNVPAWRETPLSRVLEHCSSPRVGSGAGRGPEAPGEVEEARLAIEEAIDRGAGMLMTYDGGRKPPRPTQVRPVCVFSARGIYYLEAACGDGYTRSFRLDRITRIVTLEPGC